MYVDDIKNRWKRGGIFPRWDVNPCTNEDIHKLEHELNHPLPAAYKEFLLWMGRGSKTFMIGSDWEYSILLELQEDARDLLRENSSPLPLPDTAFVFFMHQGYKFYFFNLDEGNNPSIYYYSEGEDGEGKRLTSFRKDYSSFSQWLSAEVDLHGRLNR